MSKRKGLFYCLLFSFVLLLPSMMSNSILASASAIPPLRLALSGQPADLNPITASHGCQTCWQIISLEYSYGLPVLQNGSAEPQGGLFDWIGSNANASVWDFNIRNGAKWSDGVAVNASDVLFTYDVLEGFYTGRYLNFLNLSATISSIVILNSSETEFTLNESATRSSGICSRVNITSRWSRNTSGNQEILQRI